MGSPSDPSVHPQPGHPTPSVLQKSGHPTVSLNRFWAQLTPSPTVHTAAANPNSLYFHFCISHRGWEEEGEGKGHGEGGRSCSYHEQQLWAVEDLQLPLRGKGERWGTRRRGSCNWSSYLSVQGLLQCTKMLLPPHGKRMLHCLLQSAEIAYVTYI